VTSAVTSDPYAYLEDGADPATVAWTAEQNARSRAALDGIPQRAFFAQRIEELLTIGTIDVPQACGDRTFFTARRGSADQLSLYVREHGADRILLDPAALDPAGLVSIDWWYPSPRGTFVAYGLSSRGDERSVLAVLDVATGERLGERIPDTRYCSLVWFPGERGFFYTRFPPGESYGVRVHRHVLGTAPERDEVVFGEGRKPEESMSLSSSSDGRWLVVSAHLGWARCDAYLADTTQTPLAFVPLVEGVDAEFDIVPANARLFARTDDGAPRFRVFEIDPLEPGRARWREIVPEAAAVLVDIAVTEHALALHYLHDVRSVVRLRLTDGTIRDAHDASDETLQGWSSREDSPVLYALWSSYFAPPVVRTLRAGAEGALESSVWEAISSPIDAARYRVSQEWFRSKDGTRVPMDVLSLADAPRDGSAAVVLYGYGGFNVALTPAFSPSVLAWLDAGGVYAIANARGGGEFGEAWHRAGMRERKQNVFDDFIAAAEYLGASGIADPDRIALFGGSNGGLLVAAVATQRPDLARAIACIVPLTDMLRFHLFLIARLWIAEFGDPENSDDARILRAYSPYHNVRDGVAYPAMLIETAESDTRVDPMHARKFAARLQAATASDRPILAYVEADAGHGVGKPRYKVLSELADRWAFVAWQLGVDPPEVAASPVSEP
jgi:prolyl oligopeptidase